MCNGKPLEYDIAKLSCRSSKAPVVILNGKKPKNVMSTASLQAGEEGVQGSESSPQRVVVEN